MGQADCDVPQRQAAMKRERGGSIWLGTMAEKHEEGVDGNESHRERGVVAEIEGAQVAATMSECGMSG